MTNKEDFDLFGQFAQLEWQLHRYHQLGQRIYGPMSDPHRGQGRILALLKMKPEISQKDLSYLLDIRPQSLGELLAKLERGGYISREPSETDRRIMNIKLTAEGAKATEHRPDSDTLFDCLSEEEQATFNSYLSRMIQSLKEKFNTMQKTQGMDWDDPHDRHSLGDAFEHLRHHGRFHRGGLGDRHGDGPFSRRFDDFPGEMRPLGRGTEHPHGPQGDGQTTDGTRSDDKQK
ncbi:MAG: MarR family winged helix-turn-helix transcriptional regulator [Sporolactobacillus sp.]